MTDVVQKLWGFCHTLRHDGIDYGDHIEQITYLLFLKMADERAIDLYARPSLRGRRRERTTTAALVDPLAHLLPKFGVAHRRCAAAIAGRPAPLHERSLEVIDDAMETLPAI